MQQIHHPNAKDTKYAIPIKKLDYAVSSQSSYFVANLRTFWWTFYRPKNAVVYQK